jgi:hypothetical protein
MRTEDLVVLWSILEGDAPLQLPKADLQPAAQYAGDDPHHPERKYSQSPVSSISSSDITYHVASNKSRKTTSSK